MHELIIFRDQWFGWMKFFMWRLFWHILSMWPYLVTNNISWCPDQSSTINRVFRSWTNQVVPSGLMKQDNTGSSCSSTGWSVWLARLCHWKKTTSGSQYWDVCKRKKVEELWCILRRDMEGINMARGDLLWRKTLPPEINQSINQSINTLSRINAD